MIYENIPKAKLPADIKAAWINRGVGVVYINWEDADGSHEARVHEGLLPIATTIARRRPRARRGRYAR